MQILGIGARLPGDQGGESVGVMTFHEGLQFSGAERGGFQDEDEFRFFTKLAIPAVDAGGFAEHLAAGGVTGGDGAVGDLQGAVARRTRESLIECNTGESRVLFRMES